MRETPSGRPSASTSQRQPRSGSPASRPSIPTPTMTSRKVRSVCGGAPAVSRGPAHAAPARSAQEMKAARRRAFFLPAWARYRAGKRAASPGGVPGVEPGSPADPHAVLRPRRVLPRPRVEATPAVLDEAERRDQRARVSGGLVRDCEWRSERQDRWAGSGSVRSRGPRRRRIPPSILGCRRGARCIGCRRTRTGTWSL